MDFKKYPSTRDSAPKTVERWLLGKRNDDGIDSNLWRVHDKLYNLEKFNHPGGKEWLDANKGTDITEAFEAHHINSEFVEKLLANYFVKNTETPRNSPFTFEENGFYKTLKKRAAPVIKKHGSGPSTTMNLIMDSLVFSFISTWILTIYFQNKYLAVLSGFFLNLVIICSHNYFHKKNNFRMFYFDLSMMSSSEWRVSHAISHHLFPNTVADIEVSALEPFLNFFPKEKSFFSKYFVILYSNLIYLIIFPQQFIGRMIRTLLGTHKFELANAIVIVELFITMLFSSSILSGLWLWFLIHISSSYFFSFIGLIAAHHHPDIWHHGDTLKYNSNDWGIRQIEAVRDRKDVTGNLFLVVTMFGDHTLHHLFPTVDHSKLKYLYPVLIETCKDFNIDFKFYSIFELALGKYKQLARSQPRQTA